MSGPLYSGLKVPGNLLLAGEYAVLVEGGLGLACAVEPYVHVTWQPSDTLTIQARFEDQSILWRPQGTDPASLLDTLWSVLAQRVGSEMKDLRYALILDSTRLARTDRRKSGLGSSAAAAVAATAALLYLTTNSLPTAEAVFQTAFDAHRLAQGVPGSGYDLACSTYGGMGLFKGGKTPTWTPVQPSGALAFTLVSAPRPVSTQQAVARWREWKQACPDRWAEYLNQSQRIVSKLAQARGSDTFQSALASAATLGREFGRTLGVWDPINEAFMAARREPGLCKALGAGNELLLQYHREDGSTQWPLAEKGLQWC